MFVVGLTGGIGSGKTAVSDRLAHKGIEIVDADVVSRQVVEPGTEALKQISQHFGDDILQADGCLDRAALRAKVFSDAEAKAWLEKLLHPLIGIEVYRQLEAAQSPYVLFVSPLLVEAGQNAICDRVVVVDVPEAVQIERATLRDGDNEDQIRRIIASQTSRNRRIETASDVIDNSGGVDQLDQRVNELHQCFLTMAKEKTSA